MPSAKVSKITLIPELDEPFCLECSKLIATHVKEEEFFSCEWDPEDASKCLLCEDSDERHECELIPPALVPKFNKLLRAARELEEERDDLSVSKVRVKMASIAELQSDYDRSLEDHKRSKKRPTPRTDTATTTANMMELCHHISDIKDSLEGIIDVLRAQTGLADVKRKRY